MAQLPHDEAETQADIKAEDDARELRAERGEVSYQVQQRQLVYLEELHAKIDALTVLQQQSLRFLRVVLHQVFKPDPDKDDA